MSQVQLCSLNSDTAPTPGMQPAGLIWRLMRLLLTKQRLLFCCCHFFSQRQIVLRLTPIRSATTPTGSCSLMSSFIASPLALGGVNIGNIGHSRLSFLYLVGLTTVYEACFLVAKVVGWYDLKPTPQPQHPKTRRIPVALATGIVFLVGC